MILNLSISLTFRVRGAGGARAVRLQGTVVEGGQLPEGRHDPAVPAGVQRLVEGLRRRQGGAHPGQVHHAQNQVRYICHSFLHNCMSFIGNEFLHFLDLFR